MHGKSDKKEFQALSAHEITSSFTVDPIVMRLFHKQGFDEIVI